MGDHGTRQHARYGGSAIERISLCPGSAKLARSAPRVDTSYSIDGTQAHELLDYALKNRIWDARTAAITSGQLSDDERYNAVQDCLDYVKDILDAYEDAVLYVEYPFRFPSFITDEAYGTCDVCIHIPSLRLAYIIDYKHGAGVAVEGFENKQTLYYGTGAVEGSGALDVDMAMLVIVQPRCFSASGPIQEYAVTRERLRAFINEVDDIITKAEDPNAPLIPGDKQCQFCPAKLTCPAREQRAVSMFAGHFKTVRDINAISMPAAEELSPERIAYILQVKSFIMGWFNDVETRAFQLAMDGVEIPDWKLVEKQARRKWDGDPLELAQKLMEISGTRDWDEVYPRRLISITEAEKLVKAAFKSNVSTRLGKKKAAEAATIALSHLTVKDTTGELTLVDATDSRPAADRAALAFQTVRIPAQNAADGVPLIPPPNSL